MRITEDPDLYRDLTMRPTPLAALIVALAFTSTSAMACDGSEEPEPQAEEPNAEPETPDNPFGDLPEEMPEGAQEISTEDQDLWVTEVAGPFEHPWAMAFLPDGQMLVTERSGQLHRVHDGEVTQISGLPELQANNQGGLLDVSLHPDFEDNDWIYFTYSSPDPDSSHTATAVGRARLDGDELTDVEEIFIHNQYSSPGRHYGSRLTWLGDGTFLASIGDRGADPPRAQDTQDHAGSVIRLNDDGSIPDDNPFVDDEDVLDEIYTYGNRNIQGMARDEDTDTVWASDHGPRGGDILYTIEAGRNYGWPIFTYGDDYQTGEPMDETETQDPDDLDDVDAPYHLFDPSHPPSGLTIIRDANFDAWQGNILVGGLRTQEIRRIVTNDEGAEHEEAILSNEMGRIRDVRQAPGGGAIYILPDTPDAMLYRVDAAR